MFKKNYNGNELAAAELLGIDPTLSVVTKDSNGKNYVLTLIEDEEDETAPYQAVLFNPMYRFDGREHVTDQIEGMLEFEFTLMDDEKGDEITAIHITDRYFPTAFARDNLMRFVEGFAKETGIGAVVVSNMVSDGKNTFAPYTTLGYAPAAEGDDVIAVKTKLVDRKFPNTYEELYDQFEEKIHPIITSEGTR